MPLPEQATSSIPVSEIQTIVYPLLVNIIRHSLATSHNLKAKSEDIEIIKHHETVEEFQVKAKVKILCPQKAHPKIKSLKLRLPGLVVPPPLTIYSTPVPPRRVLPPITVNLKITWVE